MISTISESKLAISSVYYHVQSSKNCAGPKDVSVSKFHWPAEHVTYPIQRSMHTRVAQQIYEQFICFIHLLVFGRACGLGLRVCGHCVLCHLHPFLHDQHETGFSVYLFKTVCVDCIHMSQWVLRSMTS